MRSAIRGTGRSAGRGADKGNEQRRLEKIFGIERAKASERIMRITEEHEAVLAKKMVELGLS